MDGKLAVIGTGTTGSMIMWRSSLRSEGIVGFDSIYPGSDATAVGGDTRMFRMAYREGSQFSGLLNDSERIWLELNGHSGAAVLDQCGALTISTEQGNYSESLIDSARKAGAEYETLSAEELQRRYPQHELLPGDGGIFDPRAGVLRTDLAVLTAIEQAQSRGASVSTGTQIDEIIPRNGMVEIRSGTDSWTFEKVVISSGAWSRKLLPARYARYVKAGRILLTWFSARNAKDYTAEKFPVFMRDSGDMHMWGAPSIDGNMVKLGGMIPPHVVPDIDRMQRELSPAEVAYSTERVRRLLPGLIPACVRSKAYPDLYTSDAQPLIGWLPEMPGVYVSTGFSGKGFKMASGVGEAVAQDLFGPQPSQNVGFAHPSRFSEDANPDMSWGRLTDRPMLRDLELIP